MKLRQTQGREGSVGGVIAALNGLKHSLGFAKFRDSRLSIAVVGGHLSLGDDAAGIAH